MTGHELLEAVQRDGVFKGPIVMLSSESGDQVARAEALGAKAWLPKPFVREKLLSTVATFTA
jgi:CheY-like chemotaxis protein